LADFFTGSQFQRGPLVSPELTGLSGFGPTKKGAVIAGFAAMDSGRSYGRKFKNFFPQFYFCCRTFHSTDRPQFFHLF
jgi:hypothetical protein